LSKRSIFVMNQYVISNQNLISHRTLGVTFAPTNATSTGSAHSAPAFTGEAHVLVWAPLAQSVSLHHGDRDLTIPLQRDETEGYWETISDQLKPGDRYTFVLDGTERPDPASLSQPDGVHGSSQAVNVAEFTWTDAEWRNQPLEHYLIYELHTGTFTPEGTFAGIEEKLDYFLELGINAIEIMPVAQFPGNRNWGYDGVSPFAVQNSYGGAAGLQRLVDACHRRGIAVVLDVVYNHIGPEGNYFPNYGPYFTSKHKTPWGDAINFDDTDSENVRRYFIENVLMWFRDFHIDALRLDAVHAIRDDSETHILREMREYVDQLMAETGRQHYLIIEFDENETNYIKPLSENGYGMDAQWNDDFHHALRVTAGGERSGYYADYEGIKHLAKAYTDAYVYDGAYMPRRARVVGKSTKDIPGQQFIVFSQNHDQVGNRMRGERPSELVSFEMQKLMAGAVMSSPYLPMLFMGEEWGELNPFLYFVSHSDPTLIEAVRQGRKEEFAAFHNEGGEAPDPQDEGTFQQSKLQWDRLTQESHQTMFRYYQTLLAIRKQTPLRQPDRESVAVVVEEGWQTLVVHRKQEQQQVVCLMNFSSDPQSITMPMNDQLWLLILDSADPRWHGPLAAPATVAGSAKVTVQPQSILVYSTTH
jgi:maltooligosyltrehalose trehalohydrolase